MNLLEAHINYAFFLLRSFVSRDFSHFRRILYESQNIHTVLLYICVEFIIARATPTHAQFGRGEVGRGGVGAIIPLSLACCYEYAILEEYMPTSFVYLVGSSVCMFA